MNSSFVPSHYIRKVLITGLFIWSFQLHGQYDQTEVRIHAMAGLAAEEQPLKDFVKGLPHLITAIINSDYFQYAVLNTPMEFTRRYLEEQEATQEEILKHILDAHEDRSDEYCRTAGLETLDVIETTDQVMDIVLEFIPTDEMEARDWSSSTAGFTPLGCPYIRVAKNHFDRYLENEDTISASRTIIHEYMHTLYFNHQTRAINRKDVPYAVEGIAKETARWLRFSSEQPHAAGRWKWQYSIKEGQLIKAEETDDSYEIELTEYGRLRLLRNGEVVKEEIAKANYFDPDGMSYGFWNCLEETERNGLDFVFDGNKLRTNYFPEAFGVFSFFEKVD